jgi:hypothetical protein
MNTALKKRITFSVLIAFTGLILFFFYGKILLSPNQYLMSTDGDGVKNYFTFVYHIRHDTSDTYFSGMNYPHEELHIFTDGSHPLSVFLQKFSETALVRGNEVAWLNLFTLLSVFPCVICIWLVLGRLKVVEWLAVIGAISITFLAPQWLRISGHFSLAILFALPLTIYLMMRFLEDKGKSLWLVVFSVAYFLFLIFTHVYLGVLSMSFFLMATIFYFLFHRKKGALKQRLVSSLISVLLAMIIFAGYLFVFDVITDRPQNPGGIMHYLSGVRSVLLPSFGPLKSLASEVFDISGRPWEGLSYIGFISVLVLLLYIVIFFLSAIGVSSMSRWRPRIPLFLGVSLLSGFILLLLSFGAFHSILGEKMSFLLGPFRQIRGLGRFAWTFYFPCLIFVFYCLNFWLEKCRSYQTRIAIAATVTFAFVLDWGTYQDFVSGNRTNVKNYLNSDLTSAEENEEMANLLSLYREIEPAAYQSILPLPFYIVGGEYMHIHIKEDALPPSVALSNWSGLPLMSSVMSRTSISLVKDRMQLLINPIYKKRDQRFLFDDRDILLLVAKNAGARNYSKWLLSVSEPIAENTDFEFRSISPASLFEANNTIELGLKDSQVLSAETVDDNEEDIIFWEAYSSKQCPTFCLQPGGAFKGETERYLKIVDFQPGTFRENVSYTVSFWVYNAFQEKKDFFLMEEQTPEGDLNGWGDLGGLADTPFVWGDWSVVEKDFEVSDSKSVVSLVLPNFGTKFPLILDNVLVRESDSEIIMEMPDSTILLNNFPLSKKSLIEIGYSDP